MKKGINRIDSEDMIQVLRTEMECNGASIRVVGLGDKPVNFDEEECDKLISFVRQPDVIRNRYIDLDEKIFIVSYEFHSPIQLDIL